MNELLHKRQMFYIKEQKMLLTSGEFYINKGKEQESNAIVVLNYWEQCDYEDISVIPVAIVRCRSKEEKYKMCRCNIVLGEVEDSFEPVIFNSKATIFDKIDNLFSGSENIDDVFENINDSIVDDFIYEYNQAESLAENAAKALDAGENTKLLISGILLAASLYTGGYDSVLGAVTDIGGLLPS